MREPLVLVTALRSIGWRIHISAGLSAVHSKRGCAAPDRAVQCPEGAQTGAAREAEPDAKPRDRAASRHHASKIRTLRIRLRRKPTPYGFPPPSQPTLAMPAAAPGRHRSRSGAGDPRPAGGDRHDPATDHRVERSRHANDLCALVLPAEPRRHSPEPTRKICLLPEPRPVRSPDSRGHSPPRHLLSRMRSVSRKQTNRPRLRRLAPRQLYSSLLCYRSGLTDLVRWGRFLLWKTPCVVLEILAHDRSS